MLEEEGENMFSGTGNSNFTLEKEFGVVNAGLDDELN